MEVFNKLYSQVSSSVSSTVSQLSGVLPGNPVTREYDATIHVASAGPGLVWKIYKGSKRSTKQEASIFVFEKRQLEKWNKSDREIILESLRRGVSQLTKIRHPQILTVQHPLEESRESLAFATEPVFASLANILGKTTNMPQPANLSDYKLFDVEIKYGLLQISEGLAFLHNDVKLIHRNIAPESIVINQQGVWKIFGLDFCVHNTNPANLPPVYPCEGFSPTLPDICQSNLEFLAPEIVLNQSNSPASDMFSVGMVAYVINSHGNQPFSAIKDLQQFRARAQQLKNLNSGKFQCIPEDLREYVKLLLNVTPEIRPDAHQFARIPYFDDVAIKTLTYLDSLLQWDNLQKSQFYKGLPEALPKLPQRVKVQRVLSCLSRDLSQPAMVPFILPSIFDIAQECTKAEYCAHVLPHLKPVMKLMEPIQILLIMLQRMELLLKLTPPEDVQQHVLPMLYRGLDSDTPQIHELCLSVLPTFAGLLDHSNVKNSLLPRIKRLCLSTSSLSVRVNCLLCVGRLLEHLDKWLVLDEILPFLPQIPSREPAVLMGILGIYKLAMNHKKLGISKEVIATRILPFLIPLCIENGLTITQFNALVTLVKEMFQLVETEHRTKLEQLNTVKDEQKVLASVMPSIQPTHKPIELNSPFSGLGLDSFVSMSLEEKQKVAQQQESFKAFQNQPAIEPVKPKDLTATLTSSGGGFNDWSRSEALSSGGTLYDLSKSQGEGLNNKTAFADLTKTQSQTGAFTDLVTSPNGGLTSRATFKDLTKTQSGAMLTDLTKSPSGGLSSRATFTDLTPNKSGGLSSGAMYGDWSKTQSVGMSMNVSPGDWSNPNVRGGMSMSGIWMGGASGAATLNSPKSNVQGNWNSLDSLLPTTTNTKIPMNQMTPKNATNPKNALSTDEIMDLLS